MSLEFTKKKIGINIYNYYCTYVVTYIEPWRVPSSGSETGCPNIFQRNGSPQKHHHYTPWQPTSVTNNVQNCLIFGNLHWTSKLGSQIAKATPKLPSCGQQPNYSDCSLKSVQAQCQQHRVFQRLNVCSRSGPERTCREVGHAWGLTADMIQQSKLQPFTEIANSFKDENQIKICGG